MLKTLSKESGGTVEQYRFKPQRKQAGRSAKLGILVTLTTDDVVESTFTVAMSGVAALQSRLQRLGFKS